MQSPIDHLSQIETCSHAELVDKIAQLEAEIVHLKSVIHRLQHLPVQTSAPTNCMPDDPLTFNSYQTG